MLATQNTSFFGHSVLDFNCWCLFSEKALREGKNLFNHCLPELFSPLFFPCFSHLWWKLRAFLILILLKIWLWQACHTTSTRVSSISWLHVKFPFSRWYMSSGGWNTHFWNTVKNLQWSLSCQGFEMSSAVICTVHSDVTPRLSSSGMLNVLTRNNTLTSREPSTKYQKGGEEVTGR